MKKNNDLPGKDYEEFEIVIEQEYFKPKDTIIYKIRFIPKIFRWLGFKYNYETEVLEEPIKENDNWVYKLKIIKCGLYWLNFKIKTYEN